jgi:hypothetical protein
MNRLEGSTDFLIQQQLAKWRVELYAAAQILKGEHLKYFKELITEIAAVLQLEVTDTGTFAKIELDGET